MPDGETRKVVLEERCSVCDGLGGSCLHCFGGRTRKTVTVPAGQGVSPDAD